MFTPDFLSLNPDQVAKTVAEDGVFSIQDAITAHTLEAMIRDVEANRSGFNLNHVTGVYSNQQFYLCHMLAISRSFAQLVTHPKVFEITERIIGTSYRLKALRYYETYGLHHMQWHTDNKTDRVFAQIPGIIFIAYISDVEDGEFQYVRGSHKWSGEKAYNDYSDDFVEGSLGKDVVSFKGRAGTVVIYDTYGIHRAKPVPRNDFVRKSLFWQIDKAIENGEPILINPEYLETIDERVRRYLGFGRPATYGLFPVTDVDTLLAEHIPVDEVMQMVGRAARGDRLQTSRVLRALPRLPLGTVIKELARRSVDELYSRVPEGAKNVIRKSLGHLKSR